MICQHCGIKFDYKKCDKDSFKGQYGNVLVYICPECRHGNYSDNIKFNSHWRDEIEI